MNFDCRVFVKEMNSLGLTIPSSWIFIDSMPIFEDWNVKQQKPPLNTNTEIEKHRALDDAKLLLYFSSRRFYL